MYIYLSVYIYVFIYIYIIYIYTYYIYTIINNRSETKIIKVVLLCLHTCGASIQHPKKKILT